MNQIQKKYLLMKMQKFKVFSVQRTLTDKVYIKTISSQL